MDTPFSATFSDTDEALRRSIAGREFQGSGYRLYVWISGSRLECRCSYVPQGPDSGITRDALLGYLTEAGITEGVIPEALEEFLAEAGAGRTLSMVLIAAGVTPEKGENGWLSYLAQPSVVDTHESDDSANIDLHNVQTFINVMPGDEIARIIPPEPGTPGKGVTGEMLASQPGKALDLKVGNGIRTSEEGSLLIAEIAGRVCLALGEISVAQEYVVAGDVDFRVGSIVFNGFVEVRGDVLDGFNITAIKGLRVNGNIGACSIVSEGDIAFCGMAGQEKGSIRCGGSITANFIHDCTVECAGDLVIDVELHNCQVSTLGKIMVNRGAVAGGCYTALGGIETKKAGSPASVKTTFNAGIDYREMAEFERLLHEQEENSARMKQACSFLELEELRKGAMALSERLIAIRNRSEQAANPKLNVKGIMYDNTFVHLGMTPKQRLDEHSGPLSIIENTIDGGLRILAMTALDVKACDLEMAFIRSRHFNESVVLYDMR
ncbi:DUF342 domain-containing protein [Geobacter sp. SVR]|uniref:DUF342 domain-containing protein n=1 Tax=Geobacter sp. SVR TaxID=2495594 RepID=UPI00143EF859|nr:FapA family protein [Geobacter sp. SVR]BCS54186.1 hypothetical protein GSVR_24940 [Geobacter sp. SVR]GCF85955.1 hypothetical protein GSbR_25550 [Geobacter sp. SVR]